MTPGRGPTRPTVPVECSQNPFRRLEQHQVLLRDEPPDLPTRLTAGGRRWKQFWYGKPLTSGSRANFLPPFISPPGQMVCCNRRGEGWVASSPRFSQRPPSSQNPGWGKRSPRATIVLQLWRNAQGFYSSPCLITSYNLAPALRQRNMRKADTYLPVAKRCRGSLGAMGKSGSCENQTVLAFATSRAGYARWTLAPSAVPAR